MPTQNWTRYLENIQSACERHSLIRWKSETNPGLCVFAEPPATEDEVAAIERKMNMEIPASFRRVLLGFSKKLTVDWKFDEGSPYKEIGAGQFRDFWHGELYWSLDELPKLQDTLVSWQDCYTDPDDDYDRHWYHKFVVCEVENCDYIVIETGEKDNGQVLYLSHDGDCDMNGLVLGNDFEDFVERVLRVGCPGSTAMLCLMEEGKTGVQPDCPNAKIWRQWFGLH